MASASIEAVGLSKSYGAFVALSNLNLKLEGSKCVGFLGPNGAGKTTTLKIFTELIRPSQGRALINGTDVHKDKKKALANCGTLVETPEIYPALTPRTALMMVAELRGIPKDERKRRIEESITEVMMEEWIDKRVGKFSKGMKQRIDIASAILDDPDIVILDEPTNGLDPRGMSEVRGIVKSLKKKGKLIFMSSHLLSEVTEICDDVAMIDHGKLLVYDSLANVSSRFASSGEIIEVTLARPSDAKLMDRISTLQGVTSVSSPDPLNYRIGIKGGVETRERLLGDLVAMNVGVIGFQEASLALEDAYLNLIKDTK
ncbi:MAG TPA: ABC transporter ATP-binding protein [Conexivisphaerales archaeon]|nr:ABC transporter ATP-binding protein [Conexivisphaerales archaeon]